MRRLFRESSGSHTEDWTRGLAYDRVSVGPETAHAAVLSTAPYDQKIRTYWPNVDESQRRLDPARNSLACFVGLTWRSGVPPL